MSALRLRAAVAGVAAGGALVAALSLWPSGRPVTLSQQAPVSAATTAPARPLLPAVGPFRHGARDAFRAVVGPVSAARLGSSHRAGCPVPVADLRLVAVTHWDFSGRVRPGELVVHRDVAEATIEVFRRLHAARFPLERVVTAERYGADDDALMAANATSGYNCRQITGGTAFSEHAYGRALDLNPAQNPYVRGTTVEPPAGRAYLDRGDVRPGMIVAGDAVVRAFAAVGWAWGGDFRTLKDYQHFSQSGR